MCRNSAWPISAGNINRLEARAQHAYDGLSQGDEPLDPRPAPRNSAWPIAAEQAFRPEATAQSADDRLAQRDEPLHQGLSAQRDDMQHPVRKAMIPASRTWPMTVSYATTPETTAKGSYTRLPRR